MPQWLRALAALSEDWGLSFGIYLVANTTYNSRSSRSDAIFQPPWTMALMWCTDTDSEAKKPYIKQK